MNKKVLSAILFSALFAGTGTFTSCIDNDEPAGIEELRSAKAELIRAKVAVEQADAAYRLAEAELKKAEAAKETAIVKIKEAKAEAERLANELTAVKNAAEEEKIKAEIEAAKLAAAKASLEYEADMLDLKAELANAQRQYEITMKQIEIAKALMNEGDLQSIEDLEELVAEAQKTVDKAFGDMEGAQRAVYEAAMNVDKDSDWWAEKLALDLKYAQAEVAAAETDLAKYQNYMENIETIDWLNEIKNIEVELDSIEKAYAALDVEETKLRNSEAFKAQVDSLKWAKEAVQAEKDSLILNNSNKDAFAFKLAETVVDTLMYFGGAKNDVVTFNFAKDKAKGEVVANLAGADYMTIDQNDWTVKVADEYAGLIADLEKEAASYTKETKYWLDSIAAMGETGKKDASAKAEAALKLYTDALTAYNSATPADDLSTLAAAAETAVTTFTTAYNAATGETAAAAKKTAAEAFRKALTAWYTAAAKNGMTFNKFALPVYSATGAVSGTSKGVNEWLADATNGADYLLMMYEGTTYTSAVQANYFVKNNSTAETVKVTIGTSKDLATSSSAAIVKTAQNLLTPLKNASEIAFGKIENYVNTNLPAGAEQNGYLHNTPDSIDFVNIYKVKGPGKLVEKTIGEGDAAKTYQYYENMGLYGYSKLALSDDTYYVAENHGAIVADLNAAVTKAKALVAKIVAEAAAMVADVNAADAAYDKAELAFDEYEASIVEKFRVAKAELGGKEQALENIAEKLSEYVDKELAEDNTDCEALAEWLAEQVKNAEYAIIKAKEGVVEIEQNIQKAEDGKYDSAEALAAAEMKLKKAEEELAKAQEELAEAMANLKTALEIMAGTAE